MVLTRDAIVNVVGNINRLGKPSLPVSRKLIKNMKLSDLVLHRIIGVGMFGRVWIVETKTSSSVYALKVMDKKEIIDKKMAKGVMRERNVNPLWSILSSPISCRLFRIGNLYSCSWTTFREESCSG